MPRNLANTVPVEASEKLAFIPSKFKELAEAGQIDTCPTFTLRAFTERERRFRDGLLVELGVNRHSVDEMRAEILRGLKALWRSETFDEHKGILEAYWAARDDFELQRKADPSIEWSYDERIEQAVKDLQLDLAAEWRPLGKMRARNRRFETMAIQTMMAVVIEDFSGLSIEPQFDRRYLDIDIIEDMADALLRMEEDNGLTPGVAWSELIVACAERMYLPEEEAKNSASPSPSATPQPNSKTGANRNGKSQASASSPKTPETE